MLRLQIRNSALARQKFARFRLWVILQAFAFLAAFLLRIFLFRSGNRIFFPEGSRFTEVFVALATGEGIAYLLTCLLGVTLYAPAAAILLSLFRGFASGALLSGLLPARDGGAVFTFSLFTLYLVLSALWFFAYGAFCACVSMRIFSSHTEKCARGEERLFGGSLFYAEIFCGTVNLRFLFTYTLFFFASLTGQLILSAGMALARARLF